MNNEFKKWLNDNSITEVECLVPDLGGTARGKILPAKKFIDGLKNNSHRMPQSIFIQTISGQYASDVEGGLSHDIYNPTDTDINIKPVGDTSLTTFPFSSRKKLKFIPEIFSTK